MDRILDRVENGYRLCILGDLKGWIGDRTRTGITGTFGVSEENENGRRVVEFCAERGLCVDNTYFEPPSLHKYTKVARGQDGVEVKSMIGLVLVKDMLRYVQVVRAMREMRRGLSDHHVVLCKVRLVGAWIKRIRREKLREHQYREGHAKSLERKRVEGDGDDNVKHMWEQVKRTMVENAREVCGSVRLGGKEPKE